MKISREIIDRMVELTREGNFIEDVCALVGIHKDTYYQWMKKAEIIFRNNEDGLFDDPELSLYYDFYKRIMQAEAECKQTLINSLLRANHVSQAWQNKAWFLERRFRKDFMQRVEVEQTVKRVELTMSREEANELIRGAEKALENIRTVSVEVLPDRVVDVNKTIEVISDKEEDK